MKACSQYLYQLLMGINSESVIILTNLILILAIALAIAFCIWLITILRTNTRALEIENAKLRQKLNTQHKVKN